MRASFRCLSAKDPPKVAVAVVSWNTRELLLRCLESLHPEAAAGRASVTVVDNGSSDGSPDAVRSRHPWAGLIEPGENLGFGRAVNLVAMDSSSEWIAAANADIEFTPGALEALLNAGSLHPQAGAIAPRLMLPDGTTQHSVHSFPSLSLALLFGLGAHRLSRRLGDRLCIEGLWDPERSRWVDWAHGALLLLRRNSFEQAGRFDESQWMYAEDIDLAWRLSRIGYRVRYEPRAVVPHAVSASTRQAFGDWGREQRHIAASYTWLARRRGRPIARLTAAINLLGAGFRLAIFGALGAIAPGRWRRPRDTARRYLGAHRGGLREGSVGQ